jgi:signal transduction histidine kinase
MMDGAEHNSGKLRVVVIDDHAPVRRNLRELLEIRDTYEVVGEASNGAEAIELVDSVHPDLVLMDVNMPVMGGIEATEAIKRSRPETKVLALTALGDMANISAMVKAGAGGYLLKGGRADELMNSLDAVANGAVALGEKVAIDAIHEYADLEARYLQAQKMEAVGRLAGGIAHDFNNVLAIIENYARFIADGMPEGDPNLQDLHEITGATERAKQLVRQLLAFSRKEVTHPQIVDLNEQISALQSMLEPVIGEDVRLQTVLADDLWSIEIDPGQLDQILMNLVVNARDAMPEGGDVWLTTANVSVGVEEAAAEPDLSPGEYVCLTILDDGLGMPPDVAAHIFEPFFTTKPKEWGTGLGLSTVFGIVKQAHGCITVDSTQGEGTRFRILLPRTLDEAKAVVAPPPSDFDFDLSPGVALVVEDDEPVCRLVERILSRNGYTVLSAHDGEEALDFLGRHPLEIDLLITDVVMPGMSGMDLAQRVANVHPQVDVVYMSGHTDRVIEQHGLDQEACLAKPFGEQDLLRKIAAVQRSATA